MPNDFFKSKNFFNKFEVLRPKLYTVVVIYMDGNRSEKPCLENPWAYMKAVNKNPNVKTSFIQD